jgi:hypothetical protein
MISIREDLRRQSRNYAKDDLNKDLVKVKSPPPFKVRTKPYNNLSFHNESLETQPIHESRIVPVEVQIVS